MILLQGSANLDILAFIHVVRRRLHASVHKCTSRAKCLFKQLFSLTASIRRSGTHVIVVVLMGFLVHHVKNLHLEDSVKISPSAVVVCFYTLS